MRIAIIALATLSFGATLMAADPFVGNWKLNVGKSKFQGTGNVASETVKITENGPSGYLSVTDSVLKSGEKRHQKVTRMLDGREHPATGKGFNQTGATDTSQQVDESTRKLSHKVNGKMGAEITLVVSPDGKTLTNRRITPAGEEILVFDRQ